jgi:hypothetical protein
MDEFENSVLKLIRSDEQLKENFSFYHHDGGRVSEKEKQFRDYVENFIEFAHSLDEEKQY